MLPTERSTKAHAEVSPNVRSLTPKPSKRRPKPKLSIEEQVLVTLEYWREYRTYFHIGTSGQISESTICRIVNKTEKMLLQSGNFRLKGKKALLNQSEIPVVTVMDVTETPIERPKKKQKDFFSGKRGYHTLKSGSSLLGMVRSGGINRLNPYPARDLID
jgi:hypothetical protein